MNPNPLLRDLEKEVETLIGRYLEKYIPAKPEHSPSDFEHDVKACLILFHAALEEFFERISEGVLAEIETEFLAKRIRLSTLCLLTAYGVRLAMPEDENSSDQTCFDYIRHSLATAKAAHSKILKDNNGVSKKYLRWLLVPVGLNVPNGPELDSLKKLANARGSFAHTIAKLAMYGGYKQAHSVMTPEEAEAIIQDCVKLTEEVGRAVTSAW